MRTLLGVGNELAFFFFFLLGQFFSCNRKMGTKLSGELPGGQSFVGLDSHGWFGKQFR